LSTKTKTGESHGESEKISRTLIENANLGIAVIQDGKKVYANSRLAGMAGYTDEEFEDVDLVDAIHSEDKEITFDRIRQRLEQKAMDPDLAEIRLITKSGETKWIEANSSFILWKGRPAVQAFIIDITERKRAEEALRQSEATTRSLLNIPTDFAVLIDPVGTILDLNETLSKLLEIPRKEAMGISLWEVLPPDVREHRKSVLKKVIKAKVSIRHEDQIGKTWFDTVLCPILDEQGEVERIAILSRNISARKKLETALKLAHDELEERVNKRTSELRQNEKILAEAQRIAHLGSWEWDIALGTTLWSDEVFRIFGMKPRKKAVPTEEFIGRVHPDDRAAVGEATKQVLEKPEKGFDHQYRIMRPDGSIRFVHEYGQCTVDGEGRPIFVLGTTQDITEIKALEAETHKLRTDLAHLDRVVTLSALTGAIAHEINQPLTAILNNAQAALRYLNPDQLDIDEVREALKDIISDDKRARDVLTRLRALVKKKKSVQEPFDLNATIQETVHLLNSEALLRKASIKVDLAPELPIMRGDRIQIQQVVINLLMNALDAVKDLPQDSRLIEVSSRPDDGPGIWLSVNDSGPGISPEVLGSIFEPFYTTKAQGTGLGLTVCRSIAALYGGRLHAENRSEGGASVSLWLPVGERGGR